MPDMSWIALTAAERSKLVNALRALPVAEGMGTGETGKLIAKLQSEVPYPEITIGVHGGLVQWTLGNPFPIRICDYDGCDSELPDVDERGQRCSIWFEPATSESKTT
jgi:hypothetical protein